MEQKLNRFTIRQLTRHSGPDGRDDDFVILSGQSMRSADMIREPYRIEAFTIALCTEGRIMGQLNLREFEIESGTLAVGFPNSVVQLDCSDESSVRCILISEEFMRDIHVDLKESLPLFMEVARNPLLRLGEQDRSEIERYFDLLEMVYRNVGAPHRLEVARGLIKALFYSIGDMYCVSRGVVNGDISVRSRREEYFVKFISLLAENYKSQRTVGFYASKLCVTPKYLSLLIKEVSGKSAADWIDSYVTLEAKTLLRFSTMSIQEVAYALNFSSQSFFGKYFKHQTGMSPSQYKVSGEKK